MKTYKVIYQVEKFRILQATNEKEAIKKAHNENSDEWEEGEIVEPLYAYEYNRKV